MSKKGNGPYAGLSGKIGGLAVKGMIKEMEQRMAAGEQVDAGPASPDEAELLAQVKDANAKCVSPATENAPQ